MRKVRMPFHEGAAEPCVDFFFIPTYFAGTREDKKSRVHDLGKFRPCTRLSYEDLRLFSAYVLQLPHHLHHLLT